MADERPRPEGERKKPNRRGSWRRFGTGVAAYEQLSDEEYQEFMGRKASIVEQYAWVADHLLAPAKKLRILDAPCSAAWMLLWDARHNPERKAKFLDGQYSKLVPSRATMDGGLSAAPDGAVVAEAIERLLGLIGGRGKAGAGGASGAGASAAVTGGGR